MMLIVLFILLALIVPVLGYFLYYWNIMILAQWFFAKYAALTHYSNKKKEIILTIDDIPYNVESFQQILSIFEEYPSCKATFFLISSNVNEQSRPLLIRAIKNGHHIANHGKTNKMAALLSPTALQEEFEHCQELITSLYAEAGEKQPKTRYYRPGSGFISSAIAAYCQSNGYEIVLGSNYPSDPHIPLPFLNEAYIWSHLKPGDIIILHDRHWTIPLLKNLFAKGLQTTCLVDDENYERHHHLHGSGGGEAIEVTSPADVLLKEANHALMSQ